MGVMCDFRRGFPAVVKLVPVALLGFLAVVISPPAARADFLDDLFGPGPAPQAAPAAPRQRRQDGGAKEQGVKAGLRFLSTDKSAAKASGKHRLSVAAGQTSGGSIVQASFCEVRNEAKEGSSDIIMYDKTLRPGDAVVTLSGVQVFRGNGGCPHKSGDFIALHGANVSRNQRNTLLSIENVMRRAEKD